MDFGIEYSDAQETFRREVITWLHEHIAPDLSSRTASREESAHKYQQRRALGRLLGDRGWLYPRAPKRYGGGGLSVDAALVLEEEFHKRRLGLPPYYDTGGELGSATILVWGTDEQKSELLPSIFTGRVRTWQLLSEPQAGSDLANVGMIAIRDGNSYVLNGQKVFVGSDHGADRMWVLAMTGAREHRHKNLSWFMVDADTTGIDVQPQHLMSTIGEGEGDVGHKNTVYFTDVKVPADRLIGGENNGWAVASTHLDLEHGAMATIAKDHLLERVIALYSGGSDSGFVADDGHVADNIAEIYIDSEMNRTLALRNYWMQSNNIPMTYEGSQAMYLKKTSGLRLTKALLEILGPLALTDDDIYGALDGYAEEQQREGIVNMHPGGTGEIHKLIIARRLGLGRADRT